MNSIYEQFVRQGMKFYPHPDHGECPYSLRLCAWAFANYPNGSEARELCLSTMLEF